MLINPRPGVDRARLLEDLRQIHTDASNLYTGGARSHSDRLLAYLDWVGDATQRLGNLISASDLNQLVLTRRSEQLLEGVGSLIATELQRLTNNLVMLELRERVVAFEAAISELRHQMEEWSGPGQYAMFDTSVFIKHDVKLEAMDFPIMLGVPAQPIHLLLPMAVIDELDNLKESKDRQVRWRAGYTLAVLENRFLDPKQRAWLRQRELPKPGEAGDGQHEVTLEILFDPTGHTRLPITDDEIIDRAVSLEPLAGRPITLVTYDTGQSMRGRAAGLKVMKLTKPLDEPDGAK
jgi:hypothetical protein